MELICCQHLPAKGEVASPFELYEVDYYDGPVNGALRCRACGRTYRFELLDRDTRTGVRVFALGPLPQAGFDTVRALLAHSPALLPSELDANYRGIRDALAQADAPEFAMALSEDGSRVYAARHIASLTQPQRWRSWLALEDIDDRDESGPDDSPDWFALLDLR